LSNVIQPLKESELLRVGRRSLIQRAQCLDSNMRMALNNAILQLLRSRKVVRGSVDEIPSPQIANSQLHGEVLICRNLATVFREYKFGRWHVVIAGNLSHGNWIARTGLDLLSVGDSLAQAKIDKIIRGGQGRNLACDRGILTILGKSWANDCRVKLQGGLGVVIAVILYSVDLRSARTSGRWSCGARWRRMGRVDVIPLLTSIMMNRASRDFIQSWEQHESKRQSSGKSHDDAVTKKTSGSRKQRE